MPAEPQADDIIIRDIERFAEMREVEELQKEVWGFSERDILPFSMLRASREVGAILVGAFDCERLVGFAYAFIGIEGGRVMAHSDMLGVKTEYRRHHIGLRLKLAQRERALALGIESMTWTFDPLLGRNAHLNFARLGAVSDRYEVNFYGEEPSSFLHRAGTDRLWVHWPLNAARVRERITGRGDSPPVESDFESLASLVSCDEDGSPNLMDWADARDRERLLVEIPGDIRSLQEKNPELAVEWRGATRSAFTEAIAAGYLVEEFYRSGSTGRTNGAYLLTRGRSVESYLENPVHD
ncbi:MAG TPA: hypothetical protein VF507_06865 [Pyrinomonadaceae bacterium]|jgi:predicted GNAT superfamily acetyltransferase